MLVCLGVLFLPIYCGVYEVGVHLCFVFWYIYCVGFVRIICGVWCLILRYLFVNISVEIVENIMDISYLLCDIFCVFIRLFRGDSVGALPKVLFFGVWYCLSFGVNLLLFCGASVVLVCVVFLLYLRLCFCWQYCAFGGESCAGIDIVCFVWCLAVLCLLLCICFVCLLLLWRLFAL